MQRVIRISQHHACLFLLLLAVMSARASMAFPGDLDLGFGGFGAGGTIQNLGFSANAMAIDGQGRLVLVGSLDDKFLHVQRRSGPRFLTVENQTLVALGRAVANAVVIAPDGKIVVAGAVDVSGHRNDFAIARLNSDASRAVVHDLSTYLADS